MKVIKKYRRWDGKSRLNSPLTRFFYNFWRFLDDHHCSKRTFGPFFHLIKCPLEIYEVGRPERRRESPEHVIRYNVTVAKRRTRVVFDVFVKLMQSARIDGVSVRHRSCVENTRFTMDLSALLRENATLMTVVCAIENTSATAFRPVRFCYSVKISISIFVHFVLVEIINMLSKKNNKKTYDFAFLNYCLCFWFFFFLNHPSFLNFQLNVIYILKRILAHIR